MSKSDKSKSSNICISIINTQSIKLEETEELKVVAASGENWKEQGRVGHFVTCNISALNYGHVVL